jgi:hypothetical protein
MSVRIFMARLLIIIWKEPKLWREKVCLPSWGAICVRVAVWPLGNGWMQRLLSAV